MIHTVSHLTELPDGPFVLAVGEAPSLVALCRCENPNCNRGHEMVPDERGEPIDGGRCRDYCIDGRPRIDVQMSCGDQDEEPCDFAGILPDGSERRFIHHTCNGKGYVSLGQVVAIGDPVPIVVFEFGNDALTAGTPQIVLDPARNMAARYWDGAGDITPITELPPDAEAGMWAVVARKVES